MKANQKINNCGSWMMTKKDSFTVLYIYTFKIFHDLKKSVLINYNQRAAWSCIIPQSVILTLPLGKGWSREADGWELTLFNSYISTTFVKMRTCDLYNKYINQDQLSLLAAVIFFSHRHLLITYLHVTLPCLLHLICFQYLFCSNLQSPDYLARCLLDFTAHCTHDTHAIGDLKHPLSLLIHLPYTPMCILLPV